MIKRGIQTTSCQCKNIRSGIPKTTPFKNKPLSYEEAQPPYRIGVTKAWNSWNTSNLKDEGKTGETTIDDMFIRRFVKGTFHYLLASEVIIKRRHNMIIICGLLFGSYQQRMSHDPKKYYFLIGYSEELLSHFLKCPVKMEFSVVTDKNDMVFKKI
ncbi:hypothetical protein SNE40_005221 [Patella caerulea]|uniref:28S ribosomal protein S24, mitochondrial n=1 Tax=Patella caerulea TaxID=87958 RepID=A0AAN8K367_PATCE